jgi:cytidine deaminase
MFGLSLGDVINLNRLAMQAADMSIQANSSEVKIGASVMTVNGNIYQGTNMEAPMASSYGTSLTAEDCAIFKALSEGQKEIKAIAVHVKHIIKENESTQMSLQPNSSNSLPSLVNFISPRLNQIIL